MDDSRSNFLSIFLLQFPFLSLTFLLYNDLRIVIKSFSTYA